MNPDELVTLNEEIAGMARAGLPLDQGLAALAREMARGRLQQTTARIASDLKAGRTLPEALANQGNRVPPFYAGLVGAGVRSGRLTDVLATLTLYARSLNDLRSTVRNALFYPTVVLLFAIVLFSFVCGYVLPQFEQIFQQFDMGLPFLTVWTLKLGKYPIQLIVVPGVLLVVAVILTKIVLRTSVTGRLHWAHFVYAIPTVGTLIRSARLAGFTELLAILVDHELPLPEAFRLAGAATNDPIMAAAATQVEHDLRQGLPLGAVMRERRLVPELIAWMTSWGEQRGRLGPTLHQVAELYRRQAEMRAAFLRYVLPPFLILITAGVLITLFVFTMILPMYKLLHNIIK
jgi:type II secretory pathway component PulF